MPRPPDDGLGEGVKFSLVIDSLRKFCLTKKVGGYTT